MAQLQEIITKKVAENIKNKISGLKEAGFEGIIVVDAPLLFECGMQDMADENWLVIASLPVRISRVGKRDGLSEAQIVSRINNQMPQREKEKLSKCILDNSGSLEELYVQIDTNLERIRNEG